MTTDTRRRILTAAEDVVLTEGVARLTLEKAAARAGVSKGGVLYHFPTRAALVSAMVERLAEGFDAGLTARYEESAGTASFAHAYVADTFSVDQDEQDEQDERGARLGAAVLAAMASEPELLAPLRAAFARWQEQIVASSTDPVRATIVRLAVDGLWLAEVFGLGPLPDDLRARVRDELLRMVD